MVSVTPTQKADRLKPQVAVGAVVCIDELRSRFRSVGHAFFASLRAPSAY